MSTSNTTWLWCAVIVLLVLELMVAPMVREIRREKAKRAARPPSTSEHLNQDIGTKSGE